ncbi:MAG: UDP-2,3-diacylglucosamine diphosphatase [Odoribacter sp.]
MENKELAKRIPENEYNIVLPEGKKIYFLSDTHLGAPVLKNNIEREAQLVQWLNAVQSDCGVLFLLGDIFDFWFEYKRVVPKGYIRFLSKICEFTDQGIPVHFFTGNHDVWVFDYLPQECGVILHTQNEIYQINGKRFLIGHGDALNPQDKSYLFLYRAFHNHFLQRCFRWIHPDWGIWMAQKWSSHSRLENGKIEANQFLGEEKEEIVRFCKKVLASNHFDYFIFGHRHLPSDISLSHNSRYINTGDWITHYSFAVFDGKTVELKMKNNI